MKYPFVIVLVTFMLLCMTCGCLDNDESNEYNGPTMTMKAFMDKYRNNVDNRTHTVTSWLVSLDDGDAVIIRDKLQTLSYHEETGESWTDVTFDSFTNRSFPIEGDISGTFEQGDLVQLRLHVTNVTFTTWNQHTNETWTVHFETFKEGWDEKNNQQAPIPQMYLHLAE